jgi:hypothetical protein
MEVERWEYVEPVLSLCWARVEPVLSLCWACLSSAPVELLIFMHLQIIAKI